jgi:hypothetical protein
MGVKPPFLFSLGGHSKQAGDEQDLPVMLSFPLQASVPSESCCTDY